MATTLLLIHIIGASVGILSGFLSMFFRKGSGLHAAAGNVFFASMLAMSSAAYIAAFLHPIMVNVVAASLTFYMVSTAWRAARNRLGATSAFDYGAMLFIVAVGAFSIACGIRQVNNPALPRHGVPNAMYFVFASFALLFAASDVRLLVRGGVTGAKRIARHLTRMCLALLLATFSFFPGQVKLFSKEVRSMPVFYLPHIFLVVSLIYWLWRVKSRKRAERREEVVELNGIEPMTS
jgi:uncharacterized membrane protein